MQLANRADTRLFEKTYGSNQVIPEQRWTLDLRDEDLSSLAEQDMNTSGYQVSDLEDIKFHWENLYLDVDAFFHTRIDILSLPQTFEVFRIGPLFEKPNLIAK